MYAAIAGGRMRQDVLVPLDEAHLIAWPDVLGLGECVRGQEQQHQQTHHTPHGGPPSGGPWLWRVV
jgi:hypothetical protein